MTKKTRGSEKMLFSCDKNGKRSLADFENVEEALQASGGYIQSSNELRSYTGVRITRNIGFPQGIPIDFFQNSNVMDFQNSMMR